MITNTNTRPQPYISQAIFEFGPTQDLIGGQVAVPLMTTEDTGTILKVEREGTLSQSSETLEREPGAAYDRDSMSLGQQTFTTKGYGKERTLPDEQIAMYGSYGVGVQAKARTIRNDLLCARERRVEDLVMNTTTFTGAALYTDNSAAPWDTAGSDVIGQVGAAIEKVRKNSGVRPNALILSAAQFHNLLYVNTAIRALWSGVAVATPDDISKMLAAVLGLKKVVVGGGVQNTNKKGGDATIGDIWSDDYAMVARLAETTDPDEYCLARTMVWSEIADADVQIKTYREEQTDSTVVKGKLNEVSLLIDAYAGHLMKIDA